MPKQIQKTFGFALSFAQEGETPFKARPLKGFGGAGVLEIKENSPDGTFRAVYTVALKKGVYVLHVFQKKSPKGIEMARPDKEMIKERLKTAKEQDRE